MKNIKQIFATALLTCVLAVTAYGGDIQTPTVNDPPPPPATSTAPGDIDTPGFTTETGDIDASGYMTILFDVLALF